MFFLKVESLDSVTVQGKERVRVKEMGNIIEVMYSDNYGSRCSIKKLDKYNYMDLQTGEIKQFVQMQNRSDNIKSVKNSLIRLRDYINTNVIDVKKCKWVTLTYAENMTDPKKLYDDFRKFNMRLKYNLKLDYEYIVACEPQGRGAWHCHIVLIFKQIAPYIDNDFMFRIWGHGWTTTKKLDDVDNVGAYLTAYLADMNTDEIDGDVEKKLSGHGFEVKTVEIEGKSKSFVKGARLYMYPPQFNLYRCSRGIKKPNVYYDLEKNVQKKVSSAKLTYEKSMKLIDVESEFEKILNYRYYNLIRK